MLVSESGYTKDGSTARYSYTYTYAAPNLPPIEILYKEVNELGTLVNSYQIINIVWNNIDTNRDAPHYLEQIFTSYTQQVWKNDTWMNNDKVTTNYGENNGYEALYESWTSNAWINKAKYKTSFDANGNPTLGEAKDWVNNAWAIRYSFLYENSYNFNNQRSEVIQKTWDVNSQSYANTNRTVYSDFQVVTSSPLAAAELLTAAYPNPTAGKITLSLTQSATPTLLQITDMTGRVVFKKQLPAASKQQELDLASYPAGLYMLQLQAGEVVATRKLIKF
ncbi:T9SS type A sorting domain-containing protein [Pontibacter sp. 13R65]|uniref:T9SS type A sorting domain-containing protein n=1 Tax=Pontibacter sp. 13R65 TaxID=3127458 RepID=UPI00301B6D57